MGWRSYPLIDEQAEPDAFAPRSRDSAETAAATVPEVPFTALENAVRVGWNTGDKFYGGFGATDILVPDYWTLRARSAQLFETNHYARGLIRRLVTNAINTGLHPEASPEERVLGVTEGSLAGWAEDVEARFALWADDPWLCDVSEQRTFGQTQAEAYREALISGDVLVVLRQSKQTSQPRVQLISGAKVRTPWPMPKTDNKIDHGVERDANGVHVAYWVTQDDGKSKRLPAWGEKSGRRLAWLVYGTDKRLDDVRGTPLLSIILQSLREVDRYRDATLRKAVVNSMLAMFIKRSSDAKPTRPLTAGGGAVRAGAVTAPDDGTGLERRSFNVQDMIPGFSIDELATGEEPVPFSANGAVEGFGVFEEAVLCSIAWACDVPPEILRLSFSSNYSASQAAINEFKLVLNLIRTNVGASLCQPIYVEWLIAQALAKKISAPQLIESWRDAKQFDTFAAWTGVDWAGAIKPAVDLSKLVKGYAEMVNQGFITRARATREATGMKFSKVVKQLAQENAELAEALAPLLAVQGTAPATPAADTDKPLDENGNHPDDPEHQEAKDVADR